MNYKLLFLSCFFALTFCGQIAFAQTGPGTSTMLPASRAPGTYLLVPGGLGNGVDGYVPRTGTANGFANVNSTGGGGGGGGGAITAAASSYSVGALVDGASINLGSLADTAYAGTGNASLTAIEKGEFGKLNSMLALMPALNGDGGALDHITNFPASQAVTGAFYQSTQPVSGTVALTAPTAGAWAGNDGYATGTSATGAYGPITQSLVVSNSNQAYTVGAMQPAGLTTTGLLRVGLFGATSSSTNVSAVTGNYVPAAGANVTIGGINSGNAIPASMDSSNSFHIVNTPSTDSSDGLAPTAVATSSIVAKTSAGNVYEMRMTQGSTAGFLVEYNATSLPAGALTASLVFNCIPVAVNGYVDSVISIPDYASAGIVILDSASCSTAATLVTPVSLVVKYK
jgi:hypothetical protein